MVDGKNGTAYPTFAGKHIQNINTLRPTPRWTGCHQYELNIKQRGLEIYDWHWIQVIKSNSTCLLLLSQDLNSQSIEWPWIAMNNLNIYHIMLYTLWLIMYIHIYIYVYCCIHYVYIYNHIYIISHYQICRARCPQSLVCLLPMVVVSSHPVRQASFNWSAHNGQVPCDSLIPSVYICSGFKKWLPVRKR